MTRSVQTSIRNQGGHLFRSAALGVLVTGAISLIAVSSVWAGTPQIVTNPNGSTSYITPNNNSNLASTGGGQVSYVNGSGSSLVTNPNGGISYVNVNGGPSLVYGPNGTLSYQNVVSGSNGSSTAIGYSTPNGGSPTTQTSSALQTAPPLVSPAVQQIVAETRPYAIPMTTSQVNGRYCTLGDGGQVWVPTGAPTDNAVCGSNAILP
jgi:hypothetical protein